MSTWLQESKKENECTGEVGLGRGKTICPFPQQATVLPGGSGTPQKEDVKRTVRSFPQQFAHKVCSVMQGAMDQEVEAQ